MRTVLLSLAALLLALPCPAQQPPPPEVTYTQPSPAPKDLAAVVRQQFGGGFRVAMDIPMPFLSADLNGDGFEDAVIVARGPHPLQDAAGFEYKVLDPYNEYFGYGNPEITASFNVGDPRSMALLIIHGLDEPGWRNPKPLAKFVLINVPFLKVGLMQLAVKKDKNIWAIATEESTLVQAVIFWDKKKYKWRPNGMAD